jgi:FKBP-type peptidyl-prolyl cis-trans isomerase
MRFLLSISLSLFIIFHSVAQSISTDSSNNYEFINNFAQLSANEIHQFGLNPKDYGSDLFQLFSTELKGDKNEQQLYNDFNETLRQFNKDETQNKSLADQLIAEYIIIVKFNWLKYTKRISKSDIVQFEKAFLNYDPSIFDRQKAQQYLSAFIIEQNEQKKYDQLLSNEQFFLQLAETNPELKKTPRGIYYEILKTSSQNIQALDVYNLHYTCSLTNGTLVESTHEKNEPLKCKISGVLPAWKEILPMMKKGDKYRIYAPPHLCYGERPRGIIPAHSILIFELELLP